MDNRTLSLPSSRRAQVLRAIGHGIAWTRPFWRILCSVLIVWSVIEGGVLVDRACGALAPSSKSSQWESAIRDFEAQDKTNPPPKGSIVFVGSSSIRMWKTLPEDFRELPVVNRGFGGSQMIDSIQFADRIVLPYQPRQVVVYAGDNDLAAGKKPEEVAQDYQAFVQKIRAILPETIITYISVKPSPSRWRLRDSVREVNRRIAHLTEGDRRLQFVDVFTPMLGPNGEPRPELFLKDQLHMNRQGYELWTAALRPYLSR